MLAARGVSLGLGKINLSDLNQLPGDRLRSAQLKKLEKKKPKIRIKKKADAKTVWAACRAVIFGSIIIAVGLTMTILGYFDKQFSLRLTIVEGEETSYHDKFVQYQLKSMQYLGPILMGIGSFILIIACVVTLESRDKHTQIITEESLSNKRRRLLSIEERGGEMEEDERRRQSDSPPSDRMTQRMSRASLCTTADVHFARPIGPAPLADIDSLDLHSCCSEILPDNRETIQTEEDDDRTEEA